jgi:hypothetical protein
MNEIELLRRQLADERRHVREVASACAAASLGAPLAPAGGTPAAWQDLAQLLNGPWDARRAAIDALLATRSRVADWRALGGIDADSICLERELYARCRAALPAGVALGPA